MGKLLNKIDHVMYLAAGKGGWVSATSMADSTSNWRKESVSGLDWQQGIALCV